MLWPWVARAGRGWACRRRTAGRTGGGRPWPPGSGGSRTWQKILSKIEPGKGYGNKNRTWQINVNLTLPSLLLDLLGEPSALFGVEHAQWQVGTANDIGAITIKLERFWSCNGKLLWVWSLDDQPDHWASSRSRRGVWTWGRREEQGGARGRKGRSSKSGGDVIIQFHNYNNQISE